MCVPFCDTCGSPKIIEFGVNTAIEFTTNNITTQNLNAELLSATSAMTQLNVNVNNQLVKNLSDPTGGSQSALEAFVKKINGEITRNTKMNTNLTDFKIMGTTLAHKQTLIAEEKIAVDKTYGEMAQPASGYIQACKALSQKTGEAQVAQLSRHLSSVSNKYNSEALYQTNGKRYQGIKKQLENKDVMASNITSIGAWVALEKNELDKVNGSIITMTNPRPIANLSLNKASHPGAGTYEIQRKVMNAEFSSVQRVFQRQALKKAKIVDSSWSSGYADTEGEVLVSLEEALGEEVNGRMESPGWYQNIKELSRAGLARELAYITAVENKILFENFVATSELNVINSINLSRELKSVKP